MPLALRAGAAWRSRLALAAVALGAFALVLAPWTIRNLTVFEEPVLISTNGNAVFVGSNCDAVYHGDFIGLWNFNCYGDAPGGRRVRVGRWPTASAGSTTRATTPAGCRSSWAFASCACGTSTGRSSRPRYESLEGRSETASRIGLAFYYPMLLLAAAGAVILRRRRAPLWPLLAFPVMVTITAVADLRGHALPLRRRAGALRAGGGGARSVPAAVARGGGRRA